MKLAFLGLGVMGYPMAGHLANAGHQVTVYNRTKSKAAHWCEEFSGFHAATPAEAADGAQIVFSCVGKDEDLREVTLGESGALSIMSEGSIYVDHTTTSATIATELSEIGGRSGVAYMDAPVSGGQSGAEAGQLSIMLGGDEVIFARVKPVLEIYAKSIKLMGPVGAGQLTKMVNQICIAGLLQGLAEGLYFSKQVGLDGEAVIAAISQGAAQSWQMDNRSASMLAGEFEFGFAVDWMRKDLAILLQEAEKQGIQLPVTQLVDTYYAEVQASGGGRWDTSSLITRLC